MVRAQPTLVARKKGGIIMHITTVGIDLVMQVIQLH